MDNDNFRKNKDMVDNFDRLIEAKPNNTSIFLIKGYFIRRCKSQKFKFGRKEFE